MNLDILKKTLDKIKNIKSRKKIYNLNLSELQELPMVNGAIELKFRSNQFFMLNINNDDGVVLKYL